MKKIATTIVMGGILAGRNASGVFLGLKLDIQKVYPFTDTIMYVQKSIKVENKAEIRFQLYRERLYKETEYIIRNFQPYRKETLPMADG